MDFDLTEDRRILQETLIRFLRDRYGWDHRASVAYTAPFHDPGAWAQLAEMGVMGMLFRESAGGYGGSGFDIATVFEPLGRALSPEPLLGVAMAGAALADDDPLCEGVIDGNIRPALALWEIDGTLDARVDGDRLSGRKSVVYGGGVTDVFLVSARDGDGAGLFAVQATDAQVTPYAMIEGGGAGRGDP